MLDYVIYGKIILDTIGLLDGRVVDNILGGGGPQGAFGARLWSDSVGFLTRSGTDMGSDPLKTLKGIDVDLEGWVQFADLPTMRGGMFYDENEYMTAQARADLEQQSKIRWENFKKMLARDIPLPQSYSQPKLIHLITEYAHENMSEVARQLRRKGAIFSLEPLIDYREWSNRADMIEFFKEVDIVTPDWPSASGIAGSEDPLEVMKVWSKLGPSLIAVRRGKYGSYTWDRNHDQFWHIPPVPVKVVDPTGAGNCYGGGLAVGWHKTGDARTSGCYADISAYFMVRQYSLPEMTPEVQAEAQRLLEPTLDSAEPL
jgi:sugar/nucleoside kinase (ribokinase family)